MPRVAHHRHSQSAPSNAAERVRQAVAIAGRGDFWRFVANGVFAAAVHFAVLSFGVEIVGIRSAALANLIAFAFRIPANFLGSRYFIFRRAETPFAGQAAKFAALYVALAAVHSGIMFLWADLGGLDYRLGFLIATALQVALSYLGNRFLVFR